ncbi:MAG: ABC transporter permease, partial [Oscillospiraceae bacterium]|nr:ABC transporter permease [Oscillospiraceae bacterium]
MAKYILKRLLMMILVIAGVILVVFSIMRLAPGDPVQAVLGANYTQEQYDIMEAKLGLEKPFIVQLFNYYKGIICGFDLGVSYSTMVPITRELASRMPSTFALGFMGIFITIIIGIPAGIISATKQYSAFDYITTVLSLFLSSMPNFWLALMLMLIFSANLGILPASGTDHWYSWIMPGLSVGLGSVAGIARLTRSSMLDVVRQDYIRTARAKGVSEGKVITKHALKNALIPIITMIGVQLGMIMGGSVIVESIFNIPGIGTYMMAGINGRDYPVVQACVLVLALSICVVNLLVDILYAFVDPRIRSQYGGGGKKKKAK